MQVVVAASLDAQHASTDLGLDPLIDAPSSCLLRPSPNWKQLWIPCLSPALASLPPLPLRLSASPEICSPCSPLLVNHVHGPLPSSAR